jgi:hypothetical protein
MDNVEKCTWSNISCSKPPQAQTREALGDIVLQQLKSWEKLGTSNKDSPSGSMLIPAGLPHFS